MLDAETKRRIDNARDVLVGKAPDPKAQVEQITIALIYKFMDDMDAASEDLGGRRSFFTDGFEQYRWTSLVRSGLGGHETLRLYKEALERIPENPNVPRLFRDIFAGAFLPYNDPETLRLFLKEIDGFRYDRSDGFGDAYEYLLRALGSQGDAGQFLTPRHVIEFIVGIVDPQKQERVLDPACGTAGFLVAAHAHIRAANRAPDGADLLTPNEREQIANNFAGYDISPDMTRLSRVNMHLHGFAAPNIQEYDTLTSEQFWTQYADVILANPPFMSPKGGIRPHGRFSVQSKRSEVLFVDYIAEHLAPRGRAGVIVPEGIIFQSQTAHTQLRKMLVEKHLAAVISLPAGVFQPYSGVKTSILILDNNLARRTDKIAFFKVESDGFDLGAQRRPIERNDLPAVDGELRDYLRRARAGEPLDDYAPAHGLIVEKARIAASGDYNLSAERYREARRVESAYPMVRLGDVCAVFNGITARKSDYKNDGAVKVIKVRDYTEDSVDFSNDANGWIAEEVTTDKYLRKGDTLIINAAHSVSHVASKIGYLADDPPFRSLPSGEITILRAGDRVLPVLLNQVVKSEIFRAMLKEVVTGIHIYPKDIANLSIPLPSMDAQMAIVEEIEGYQRVLDGARAVVEGWRPRIAVDPSWPMARLGDVCEVKSGFASGKSQVSDTGVPHVRPMNITSDGLFSMEGMKRIPESEFADKTDYLLEKGDVLFNNTNSNELVGKTCYIEHSMRAGFSNHITRLRAILEECDPKFLAISLHNEWRKGAFSSLAHRWIGQAGVNTKSLMAFPIPLPPMEVQRAIVEELEGERLLVGANRELMERMASRIAGAVGRAWGSGAG